MDGVTWDKGITPEEYEGGVPVAMADPKLSIKRRDCRLKTPEWDREQTSEELGSYKLRVHIYRGHISQRV